MRTGAYCRARSRLPTAMVQELTRASGALSTVRAVAYLYALAHNLLRMMTIAPQMLGRTGASAMVATPA